MSIHPQPLSNGASMVKATRTPASGPCGCSRHPVSYTHLDVYKRQVYERVSSYNSLLVAGMSLWLLTIVFLPFPTELLSSANHGSEAASHAIYVGTLLVAALAGLVQRVAIVHWPDLQTGEARGSVLLYPSVIFAALIGAAFVIALLLPANGLWALLLLLLSSPLERLVARRRPK